MFSLVCTTCHLPNPPLLGQNEEFLPLQLGVPEAFVKQLDSVSKEQGQRNPGGCLSFDAVVGKYATNFSSWY